MTKSIIKSVVNKYDPVGLLGLGCPEDEYEPEIERIFARIREGMTVEEISEIIHAVFFEMFEESIDQMQCKTMTCEMLSYHP